jgi:hypothetical protein
MGITMNKRMEYNLKCVLSEFFTAWDILYKTPRPEVGSTSGLYNVSHNLNQSRKAIKIFYHAYYEFPAYDPRTECSEDLHPTIKEICTAIENIPLAKSKKQGALKAKELNRLAGLWRGYKQ